MEKEIGLTPEELKALSLKMEKFNKGLSEKEKDIMNLILARAGGGTDKTITADDIHAHDEKETILKLAGAVSGKVPPGKQGKPWFYVGWIFRIKW